MIHGLSFDVEEHFHALNLRPVAPSETWERQERRAADSTRAIMDTLDRHAVKATFFFLGWVAKRDPELVRDAHRRGHEIASHGMSHQMANELGRAAFRDEARESKQILEDAIGAPILGFRASTFSVTPATEWALPILAEEGYRYDSSIFPVRHDRYGYPSFSRTPVTVETTSGPIIELPMLTLRKFGVNLPAAGGGYLRLLPLALVRRALFEMKQSGHPGMLYLHPWEFDPGQPRLLKGGLGAFRHYFGLSRTMGKLEQLLRGFSFGPVRDCLDAASAKRVLSEY